MNKSELLEAIKELYWRDKPGNARIRNKAIADVVALIRSFPEEPVIEMIEYDGEPVPKELCTIGRDGIADDFLGCGACFEVENGPECADCPIDKMFKHYAALTGQKAGE